MEKLMNDRDDRDILDFDFDKAIEETTKIKENNEVNDESLQLSDESISKDISKEEYHSLVKEDYKKALQKSLIQTDKFNKLPDKKEENNLEEVKINPRKCKYINSNGDECNNWVIQGSNFCSKHTSAVVSSKTKESDDNELQVIPKSKARSGLYTNSEHTASVQYMIEQYKNDPDLETLDIELAYMKTLPDRIENLYIAEGSKIELLGKILIEISKLAERRQKIIEAKRFYLEVSQISYFIGQVLNVINRHVQSPEEKLAIKTDLQGLYLKRINK